MFRSESARERTLLRVIEQQQQTIRDLTDRLMYFAGRTWTPPPLDAEPADEDEQQLVSALDRLPGEWDEE